MAGIDGSTGQTLCLYIPSLWRLCYHLPFSNHSDRTTVAGNYAFSGEFPVSNWSGPRHCPFVEKSLNPPWFSHKLYRLVMDTHSSGADFLVKARKPYTITKQQERWTEGEHNKFLEALKLYGRAWQCIEEHIGTKTVVQIRSHAQKFFSKLEKEAHVSGVSIGQSIGIDIPPPRPRRKPSNPYPRKSSSAPSTWATSYAGTKDGRSLSSASSSHCKRVVDLEIKPLHERPTRKEVSKNAENQDGNSSDVFTLRLEDHSSSVSSANNNAIPSQVALRNPGTYREFVPWVKGVITQHATNESHVTMKRKENPRMHTMDAKRIAEDNDTSGALESGNTNSAFRKKFCQGEKAGHQNCAFHHNLEDYESFLCSSSTFSTLTVSSLLQNPAVHAAVAFWPYANAKDRKDPPSMASIAAATVTAATAWWAAHGLRFPVSMTRVPVPLMDSGQAPPTKIERGENSLRIPSLQDQQSDPKHSEAVEAHHSALKSPTMPNSDDDMDVASTEEVHDSNNAKSRKQVYHSSYGSNTPSGSGVETDASKKRKKGKEELKETDINHPSATSSDHCSRTVNNMSDSWKEVSEEGRMAFQALFSREVLRQIFSLPHDLNHKGHQKDIMEEEKQNFQL